jgi:predicted membrane protein
MTAKFCHNMRFHITGQKLINVMYLYRNLNYSAEWSLSFRQEISLIVWARGFIIVFTITAIWLNPRSGESSHNFTPRYLLEIHF